MDKAYLRHGIENSETFELTFHYTNPDLKVDRQFNFSRRLSEPVSSFLERVNANVEKVLKKKRKKINDEQYPEQIGASLIVNNAKIDGEIECGAAFKPENDVILKVLENQYKIIINAPWIESIALPKSILANFPVYPSKFESIYTNKKLSVFTWYKSDNKSAWIEAANGFIYMPRNEDINLFLKLTCIPKNEANEGPAIEVVSDIAVQASPGECPFDLRHRFTAQKATGKE